MALRFQTNCSRLAIVLLPMFLGACVNLVKPKAVAECAAKGNCTEQVPRDTNGAETSDASAPDQSQMNTSDGAFAPPTDAPGRDLAGATTDSYAAEVAGESGADAARADVVSASDSGTSRDGPWVGELGDEVETRADSEGKAEPGPEPGPETGRELGPEAVLEPGPEPGPEPPPEPPADAGVVGSCPSGGICDDFEDGDYSTNPVWTVPGGFAVTADGSKVLSYAGTDTPAVALVGNKATALTIKAKVKATAFGGTSNSYRVGVFARANSQGTPSTWYAFSITGDGSLRLQVTDSTPSGCSAVDNVAVAGAWYILTLTVSGTAATTTLQGTLTDAAGGNAKTIGPCTIANGLAAGWAGVGVRGGGTRGEWDDVQITGITP